MKELEQAIFEAGEEDFTSLALRVFQFQYENNSVYRTFADSLQRNRPEKLEEIPFLPIDFFKTQEITCFEGEPELLFLSSGTTQSVRSKHLVKKAALYEKSFLKSYQQFTGAIDEQVILALLPSYQEQGNSGLVYMVDHLIQKTQSDLSGFFREDTTKLLEHYAQASKEGKKIVIFGVSYALLDLAELKADLSQAIIIETGGMKGRREELTKEELHSRLKAAFQTTFISSEYGMTELLSQAYSLENGFFRMPSWMKILIRDMNDPLTYLSNNKTGGINVIDLANLYSCSFIATQDLGQITDQGLKLMGRFDHSDIRGCNLLVE